MNNDLISREALLNELDDEFEWVAIRRVKEAPAVDAEPVRHEGNTTFIATENLGDYADRIIVGQGTACKVYYIDEPVRHGRWIHCEGKSNLWYCSECGEKIIYNPTRRTYRPKKKPVYEVNKRCRNCGARMEGK